jgi:hypothetical protein
MGQSGPDEVPGAGITIGQFGDLERRPLGLIQSAESSARAPRSRGRRSHRPPNSDTFWHGPDSRFAKATTAAAVCANICLEIRDRLLRKRD